MALDRDLTVIVGRALARGTAPPRTGWEMLAATGVRGLRLRVEAGIPSALLLTERNELAFELLRRNVEAQGLEGVRAARADAREPPAESAFDYVDLDPYGTPVPFVPSALRALREGGVLAVTATDMPVLAGPARSVCLRRYGSRPIRGRLGPEGGLRILMAYLDREARARSRALAPLFAYVGTHHVRLFARVVAAMHDPDPSVIGTIDPRTWTGPEIDARGPVGPLWLGPLFSPEIVAALDTPEGLASPGEATRFIERVRAEAGVPVPFYYETNLLAHRLSLPEPPSLDQLILALRTRGFRASRTHARPEGVRSDAPRSVVQESAREAVRSRSRG